MANLMPEVARMLGVELGEEFKIKGYGEVTYMIADNKGLMATDDDPETEWTPANALFVALLNGEDEIVKLPWKPKERDIFYSFSTTYGKWVVRSNMWAGAPCDYALLDKGWVYRTRAEAEDALPKVAAEMGVKYEL